jgi:hypothetical protein
MSKHQYNPRHDQQQASGGSPPYDPFTTLADKPRWVDWREEERGGKPTKTPYNARNGRQASTTDPNTWATRQQARARLPKLLNGTEKGGIGIVLGADPGPFDIAYLCGIDLDSCIDERGIPASWAAAIVAALDTYTEVSPSGRGLKAFFYIRSGAVRSFLDRLGVAAESWGTKRGIVGRPGGDHGPGIELYCSHRYFTVTGRLWSAGGRSINLLNGPELEALAKLLPKPTSFKAANGNARRTQASSSSSSSDRDDSRSAKAWRAAYAFKDQTYEDMCKGLRDHEDDDIRDWVKEKGETNNERELHRLWDRGIAGDEADADDTGGADKNRNDPYQFPLIRFNAIGLDTTRPYLVRELIPREGLTVVWGPPKCGKTFWTFDLMMHVALGWPYRGKRVDQATVVYVACEGERGLKARKEAFRQKHLSGGLMERGLDPPFYLLTTRLNLPKQADKLARDIADQIPPGVVGAIVIDTLNRSIGGSESSDEDMTKYVDAAGILEAQFQCAVIVIHHCGVDGTRPRGHTSLTGSCAGQLGVQRNQSKQIITTVEYLKDGPEGERLISKLDVIEVGVDEDGENITSCVVLADKEEGMILGHEEMAAAQKIALDTLTRALDEKGEVSPEREGIPPNTTCVPLETWRQYAYDSGISTGVEVSAKRQAFRRASRELIAKELVGMHRELVWLIRGWWM